MICNSKSASESVRPPSATTFSSIKRGEATCLLSSNSRDRMLLNQILGDDRYVCPTVKHDSNRNFRAICPAEFHLKGGLKPNLWRRRQFLFLSQFFFWLQMRNEGFRHMAFHVFFKLSFNHIGLPFDTAPATTRRGKQ